jgi:hypothetical protein
VGGHAVGKGGMETGVHRGIEGWGLVGVKEEDDGAKGD